MMSVSMRRSSGRIAILALFLAGCAPVQTRDAAPGPPPPQNVIGSTDELQLVVELSLDLARQHGGDRILVALDVDNTLLAAGPEACSGDWPNGAPTTVQPDAAKQVSRMQEAGLRVIAVSSRDAGCFQRTEAQLSGNGFDFRASAWPYTEMAQANPAGGLAPLLYRDGLLMGSGSDRGRMVSQLLEHSGADRPVLIVLADERQANLNAVMKAFSFSNTKVHAWRYTRDAGVTVSSID
jgi:hypothetical protein